ncbi:MAG: DUF4355 domain-containing protein [Synergistaceae bacterium]
MFRNSRYFLQRLMEDNGGAGNPPGGTGKTFTQAELDSIVQDRLKREKEKYADYEELKKAKEKLDELDSANKSELDKLKADYEKMKKSAEEKEAQLRVKEIKDLKAKLCADAGIKSEFADRVAGEDEESIKKDIEALKKLIPAQEAGGKGTPPPAGGKKETETGDALRDSIRAFYNK